jgi:glutamyl-tRNA(Gln) amidotransferase subunit D
MYSKELEKLLKKKKIEIGDSISIETDKFTAEGMLMPRAYKSDILVIKMGSGYNIGVSSKKAKLTLVKKAEKAKSEKPKSEEKMQRGDIAILGCGGTIASKVEYKTGAVFPAISPHELKNAFPALDALAKVHSRQLFSLFSEDMNSSHWQIIAKAIEQEIKEGIEGVVLMHGTDTMHYTSAAISFMLQDLPVPVIFVGAQRSSDRPSSDNDLNLMNSVYAAKQDFAEVGVCMHATRSDDYCHLHRGTRARKFHTSARDAFVSVNSLPLAKVDYRNNVFESYIKHKQRDKARKLKIDARVSDNVALIYAHPNLSSKFISSLSKFDGVVIAGTGLGHVATNPFGDKTVKSVLPAVKDLVKSGVPVVMTTQAFYGRVNMNVYTTGRLLQDVGVIGDGLDITPETAFVKLSWILGHEKKMAKIKEEFYTNMAGEFGERSPLEVRI